MDGGFVARARGGEERNDLAVADHRRRAEQAKPGHVRITVLACRPQLPHHLVLAVVVSPPGDLCGLTRAS